MELQINGRNMELTERLDEYVRRKVSKLDRYLPTIANARMELSYENTRSAGDSQVAQLTIRSERGVILRAEERTADMFASIDAVMDKMYRQIARYKGKRRRSRRGAPVEELGLLSEPAVEEEDEEREVVRVKRFQVVPMLQEEAIEQMELLGHDFFVFYNAEENGINVLYRRKDSNYGLLIPDLG
jgi:putative sigma-54 modulation protein